jgi:hypothetical protein
MKVGANALDSDNFTSKLVTSWAGCCGEVGPKDCTSSGMDEYEGEKEEDKLEGKGGYDDNDDPFDRPQGPSLSSPWW